MSGDYQIRNLKRLHWGFLAAWLGLSALASGQEGTVKLRWFLGWEPDIAGYRVHCGADSRNYTTTVDVGYKITAELTGLTVGATYFCAVTAYNTAGLESDYSDEISFVVDPPPGDGDGYPWDGYVDGDIALTDGDGDGLPDQFESAFGGGEGLEPTADLNGDGLSVLAEFAHGIDPTAPTAASPLKVSTLTLDGLRYLSLRYVLHTVASENLDVRVERSLNPFNPTGWQTGHTIEVSSEPVPDDPNYVEIVERSLTTLPSAHRAELFRLRYEPKVP